MLDALFVSLPWAGALVYVLRQHADERRHLLNRIQAPEVTVQRDLIAPSKGDLGPAAVLHDDDADYWSAIEERESPSNLSELIG